MKTASDMRKDRLAAALRENLKRRKQRARALAGGPRPAEAVEEPGEEPIDGTPGEPYPKGTEKPL